MKHYGLLGKSLKHSFSARYFQEKFEKHRLEDCMYTNFELPDIGNFIDLKHEPDIAGLNVTIPYKESIIALLDELSAEAFAVGAVNCIQRRGNTWIGHNTDAFGFQNSIKPFLEPKHDRALILGDGGAAKAVRYVLDKLGIPYLCAVRQANETHHVLYENLSPLYIEHHKLIINTTPLGTYPNIEDMPNIPTENIGPDHFIVDLIYNPEQTRLLKIAANQGAISLNGLSMLQLQAEKSWEIWNS